MKKKEVSTEEMLTHLYSLRYMLETTNFKTHPEIPEYFYNKLEWNQQVVDTMIAKLEVIRQQEEGDGQS